MSEAGEFALANGPESRVVVGALDAILGDDADAAQATLLAGAEEVGWEAIAHRIDVAGRALAVDAGITPATIPDEIDLTPALRASFLTSTADGIPDVLARWWGAPDAPSEFGTVWPSLVMLAWLVDRAGFPAEVVI